MIKFVNAKINLGLRVLRRRTDGYHELSTVFYPVGKYAGTPRDYGRLSDILEITKADADSLTVGGAMPDCRMEDNLVWKALQLYRSLMPTLPPVNILLEKQLPSQAGLGGGSADAAFTLSALNELCDNALSEAQLLDAALQLGADCPFFIINRPCVAAGIGEKLTPIELNLSGLWIAVIKPAVSISTAEAFRYVTPREPETPITEIVRRPVEEWRDVLVNDFEESMFKLHPEIKGIKDYLYSKGALYASMSGSGSSFYGIYRHEEQAHEAAADCGLPYHTVALL